MDDHPLLREGIAAALEGEPDIVVVAEASNGREAIESFRKHHPDITLMDLQMPEMKGVEAIAAIRAEYPGARIIVLTTYNGDVQALRAIKAGASGYLLKSLMRTELLETIRAVHAGRRCIPSEIAAQIADHVADDALTERETEVLRRIAAGDANKEVAAQLGVTEETVKAHVKSILSKLGANGRTHAVTIAAQTRDHRDLKRRIAGAPWPEIAQARGRGGGWAGTCAHYRGRERIFRKRICGGSTKARFLVIEPQ